MDLYNPETFIEIMAKQPHLSQYTHGGLRLPRSQNNHKARKIIEDGFEYVMDKEGVSLFRKLK